MCKFITIRRDNNELEGKVIIVTGGAEGLVYNVKLLSSEVLKE